MAGQQQAEVLLPSPASPVRGDVPNGTGDAAGSEQWAQSWVPNTPAAHGGPCGEPDPGVPAGAQSQGGPQRGHGREFWECGQGRSCSLGLPAAQQHSWPGGMSVHMVAVPPAPHAPSPCPVLWGAPHSGRAGAPRDPRHHGLIPADPARAPGAGSSRLRPQHRPLHTSHETPGRCHIKPLARSRTLGRASAPCTCTESIPTSPPASQPCPGHLRCLRASTCPGHVVTRAWSCPWGSPLRRVARDHRHCARGPGAAYLLPRGMGSVRAGTGPRAPRVSV